MVTFKLTSKRQATFPAEACAAMRIAPGDVVEVESRMLDGEKVWLLRPRKAPQRPWLGCLGGKTSVKDHSMESVRASIAAGRKKERA